MRARPSARTVVTEAWGPPGTAVARRAEVASVARVSVMRRHTPPPRQKVCKVFETKDIRLDFNLTSYAKSKSPARAGLRFFSELSIAALSMGTVRIGQLAGLEGG